MPNISFSLFINHYIVYMSRINEIVEIIQILDQFWFIILLLH